MRNISFFFFLSLVLIGLPLQAQNEIDVLRYARSSTAGTARSLALGGAVTALGVDHSSAYYNPAGFGLSRKSEFSITPTFRMVNTPTSYLGVDGGGASSNKFGISHLGVSFYGDVYRYGEEPVEEGLKSYTFAFGFNQLDNYYQQTTATAFNPHSSITEMFAEQAFGQNAFELDGNFNSFPGLAFTTYGIDTIAGTLDQYMPAVNNGRINQTIKLLEEGRNNEWFIALSGNINDRLYIGGAIGIQDINYEQVFEIKEDDTENVHEFYNNNPSDSLEFPTESLTFQNSFETSGSGINARIGAIYRVTDAFRIGANLQTPTVLTLTDIYTSSIDHSFTVVGNETQTASAESDLSEYEYCIITPFRASFGALYMIKKYGFLSADVEYTDYVNSKLKSSYDITSPFYYDFQSENERVDSLFNSTLNYRVGAEVRFDPIYVRAGGAFLGGVLNEETARYQDINDLSQLLSFNPDRRVLSFGIGLRQPTYYLDVVFVNQTNNDKVNPYTLSSVGSFTPALLSTKNSNSVSVSLGFNF